MPQKSLDPASYIALSELRYRIRKFLSFSERAAREAGLEPQHHQLLLTIKGLPEDVTPTMGALAERLQLQHHSCVELSARAEAHGLVARVRGIEDRRQKTVRITTRGERLLAKLSAEHVAELSREAPSLIDAISLLVVEQYPSAHKKKEKESWQKTTAPRNRPRPESKTTAPKRKKR